MLLSRSRAFVLASLAAALALAAPVALARDAKTNGFRVMTFNIRFDFPDDGANRWHRRADIVAECVKDSKASVVCFQEDKREQVDDLKPRLAGWEFYGKGRNKNFSGEGCSVAWQRDSWKSVESGDFWLSDKPDEPGSNTWGCKYPHKVTWAVLENLKTKTPVMFLSTHFDEHKEKGEVRKKSAHVIRSFLSKKAGNGKLAICLCGDFNSGAEEEPHGIITAPGSPLLADAWDVAKPADPSPGTVHDFTGKRNRHRIDWIVTTPSLGVAGAAVHRYSKDGKYPSDHYPVVADLEIKAPAATSGGGWLKANPTGKQTTPP